MCYKMSDLPSDVLLKLHVLCSLRLHKITNRCHLHLSFCIDEKGGPVGETSFGEQSVLFCSYQVHLQLMSLCKSFRFQLQEMFCTSHVLKGL